MKAIRIAVLTCAVILATSSMSWASLVLVGGTPTSSFTDLGGNGFGNAPRMLTLQTNTVETGSVTPVGVVHDDAISGADKSSTPTLSSLGWTSGAQVGIGFNSGQTGNSGITLQFLTLTIYNGTTPVVGGTFSTTGPINFTATELGLQQGNGNAVFNFALTPAEQAQFNAVLALAGSGNFTAGLSAQLGCPAGAPGSCQPSNDGPDSFLGFSQGSVPPSVPEPTSVVLLGSGLLGLVALRFRRNQ